MTEDARAIVRVSEELAVVKALLEDVRDDVHAIAGMNARLVTLEAYVVPEGQPSLPSRVGKVENVLQGFLFLTPTMAALLTVAYFLWGKK